MNERGHSTLSKRATPAVGAAVVLILLSAGCLHADADCADGNFYGRCTSELCYLAGGWHTKVRESLSTPTPVGKTGILIGFPLWVEDREYPVVNAVAFSPVCLWGTKVNGIVIAPFHMANEVNGVSIGPLIAASPELNGLSLSVLSIVGDGNSGQMGIFNYRGFMGRGSTYDERGIFQLGIYNRDSGRGVNTQCGFFNQCDEVPYFQIGFVNLADKTSGMDKKKKNKHPYLQIGLCNSDGRRGLPLINLGW